MMINLDKTWGLVSKETVVLRRCGSGKECLVLSKELIRKFGHRKDEFNGRHFPYANQTLEWHNHEILPDLGKFCRKFNDSHFSYDNCILVSDDPVFNIG